MAAELRPGPQLEQLLERADAAGQRNEAVGQFGHQGLALVHGGHDPEVPQAGVRHLPLDQGAGDDADHLAARCLRGIGQRAHQAYRCAAVDDTDPAPGQKAS